MKKLTCKFLKVLSLCLLVCSMFLSTVMAAETDVKMYSAESKESGMQLCFISPEDMEQLTACREIGIDTYNWFPDSVLVTIERQSDGHCKVVFMNNGFPFDRCDVDGTITLYNMNMGVVANQKVREHKLVYGVARVLDIYPMGGQYATGSYSLRLSDGDAGTLYTGTF